MLLDIANQRIEEIRPQADAKAIQLNFAAPESLPPILGDEARMGQVFTNLIGNAIKFTPDNGEITVKLKVDGNLLHVEIIDTGPGIPSEERQKIFDKFLSTQRYSYPSKRRFRIGVINHKIHC